MWGFLRYSTNLTNPTQVVVSEKPNAISAPFQICTFQSANYTSICTSPMQMALGFQAGGANLTWSRIHILGILPGDQIRRFGNGLVKEPQKQQPPSSPTSTLLSVGLGRVAT